MDKRIPENGFPKTLLETLISSTFTMKLELKAKGLTVLDVYKKRLKTEYFINNLNENTDPDFNQVLYDNLRSDFKANFSSLIGILSSAVIESLYKNLDIPEKEKEKMYIENVKKLIIQNKM